MKKVIFFLLLPSIFLLNVQVNNNVENHQVKIGLPMPSILYEKEVSKNATLSIYATIGLWIRGCTACETEFGVYPILRGQY